MADVFSGLMAAVGAADKVLELMNRTPEVRREGGKRGLHCAKQQKVWCYVGVLRLECGQGAGVDEPNTRGEEEGGAGGSAWGCGAAF